MIEKNKVLYSLWAILHKLETPFVNYTHYLWAFLFMKKPLHKPNLYWIPRNTNGGERWTGRWTNRQGTKNFCVIWLACMQITLACSKKHVSTGTC